MEKIGPLTSSPIAQRYPGNPILAPEDLPYESRLVYNAGVVKYQGRYVMVFRNDYGFSENEVKAPNFQLGLAYSADGIHWQVQPKPILEPVDDPEVLGNYDPRLTLLEGRVMITYAQYTRHGFRATIAATTDFERFEIIDRSVPDNRDNVLFPEKIDGRYWRMERPFPYWSRQQRDLFDIWISESPDLVYWGKSGLLLCVEDVPYANEKLGAGTPPVRTERGWLMLFHAVDTDFDRGKNGWEERWQKRYTAGVLLLDLQDPRKVLGVSQKPLLAPEAPYEIDGGFRNNIVFPTGLVVEDDGEAKIYYAAADTVTCLATARVDDLVDFALGVEKVG